MADFVLGMNAKLYHGAEDAAIAAMSVADNVRDLTLNMEAGEADVTTRGNSGWRGTAATLKEATLEFEMVWDDADTFFAAIKAAYLANTLIGMCPMTGLSTVAGTQGPRANWSITNFSRSEPLEEAIIVSVTAKLADYLAWETGSGGGS